MNELFDFEESNEIERFDTESINVAELIAAVAAREGAADARMSDGPGDVID